MTCFMLEKLFWSLERFETLTALKGPLLSVGQLMDFEVSLLPEGLPTKNTGKGPLSCMDHEVSGQLGAGRKHFVTQATLLTFWFSVSGDIHKVALVEESLLLTFECLLAPKTIWRQRQTSPLMGTPRLFGQPRFQPGALKMQSLVLGKSVCVFKVSVTDITLEGQSVGHHVPLQVHHLAERLAAVLALEGLLAGVGQVMPGQFRRGLKLLGANITAVRPPPGGFLHRPALQGFQHGPCSNLAQQQLPWLHIITHSVQGGG